MNVQKIQNFQKLLHLVSVISARQFQSIYGCVYPNQLFEFMQRVCVCACVSTVWKNTAVRTHVLQSSLSPCRLRLRNWVQLGDVN